MNPAGAPELARSLDMNPDRAGLEAVTGGDIARSYRLADDQRQVFVKCLDAGHAAVLEAERIGLEALARSQSVRVPRVHGSGRLDDVAWLALEWLDMRPLTAGSAARLGVALTELHQRSAGEFGFRADNFIGRTPQPNTRCLRWSEFFIQYRIRPQLERLAAGEPRGGWSRWLEPLEAAWNERFGGYQPRISLIHGDLWSGNAAQTADGEPVVFDPAVHYADRECDLAMAELFGGFPSGFFSAYQGTWPLDTGFEERRRFYQLYHLLNHANLFGGHYLSICRKLVRELAGSSG